MPAGLRPAAVFLRALEHIQQRRAEIPLRLCSDLNALQQILSYPVPGRYGLTTKASQQNPQPQEEKQLGRAVPRGDPDGTAPVSSAQDTAAPRGLRAGSWSCLGNPGASRTMSPAQPWRLKQYGTSLLCVCLASFN